MQQQEEAAAAAAELASTDEDGEGEHKAEQNDEADDFGPLSLGSGVDTDDNKDDDSDRIVANDENPSEKLSNGVEDHEQCNGGTSASPESESALIVPEVTTGDEDTGGDSDVVVVSVEESVGADNDDVSVKIDVVSSSSETQVSSCMKVYVCNQRFLHQERINGGCQETMNHVVWSYVEDPPKKTAMFR